MRTAAMRPTTRETAGTRGAAFLLPRKEAIEGSSRVSRPEGRRPSHLREIHPRRRGTALSSTRHERRVRSRSSRAKQKGENGSEKRCSRVRFFCAVLKSPPRRQMLHQDCSSVLQAFDSDTLFSGCDHVINKYRQTTAKTIAKTQKKKKQE